MVICSKTSCSCTLATCYTVNIEDDVVLFVEKDTNKEYKKSMNSLLDSLDSNSLVIGGNNFTSRACRKLERFIHDNS